MKRFAAALIFTASAFVANVSAAAPEEMITISTIADPPAEAGIDTGALREATEEALKALDVKDVHRPVSVAIAIISAKNEPTANCVINIAVHDRKKGIILGTAAGTASGNPTNKADQRASVARTAVANAMSRVPDVVLAAKN
jgi:hypothetical protein